MKPLKEHASLFANGKFKFHVGGFWDAEGKMPRDEINNFKGIEWDEPTGVFWLIGRGLDSNCTDKYLIRDCTLIARPIEDMTEGELARVLTDNLTPADYSSGELEECKKALIEEANNKSLYLEDAKNMAEIGVYFGPQSHFDDGTVLNINDIY